MNDVDWLTKDPEFVRESLRSALSHAERRMVKYREAEGQEHQMVIQAAVASAIVDHLVIYIAHQVEPDKEKREALIDQVLEGVSEETGETR